VSINNAASVIPALVVNLVLDIEVDNTHNTIWRQQRGDGVNDRVKLRDHAERIAHGDKLRTASIRVLVKIADILALKGDFFTLVGFRFMLVETESACILADYSDVLPSKPLEALFSHGTQAWGEIHDIC
jgi:hypothetical protein